MEDTERLRHKYLKAKKMYEDKVRFVPTYTI